MRAAAGAVAADGLGHLAATNRAGRRGAFLGGLASTCGSSAFAAPRPRRRDRLQPQLPACADLITHFSHEPRSAGWLHLQIVPPPIGRSSGRRCSPVNETGTFRCAWTGLRAVALGARQAGDARGRGDRRCRCHRRAVLWYYQLPRREPSSFPDYPRSVAACSTCAGWRSLLGRWRPSRSVAWPACSSAGSSPRSSPPWPPTRASRSWLRTSCASTT